ncbi:cystathionine gamma-synthase [Apiospora saccharicola]|uniref:Cystathionine gamma-synthase n=1 Tax=Apiospora saccharicola TaxID=335842 RepID=A0ABR1UJS4_9PEZI
MPGQTGFGKPLGEQIPDTRHAISVSLPTWEDVVAFAGKDPRVMGALKGGYPRFVLHKDVVAISELCIGTFRKQPSAIHAGVDEATHGLGCLLFPSITYASDCQEYIAVRAGCGDTNEVAIRRFDFIVSRAVDPVDGDEPASCETIDLYAVFYREKYHGFAKRFWRISGTGISSRLAEDVLRALEESKPRTTEQQVCNRHPSGSSSHRIIQQRIASLLQRGISMLPEPFENHPHDFDDIHLYPTGMAAIYSLTNILRPWSGTSAVIFGFPYDSTLRVQESFAKGHLFYGHGTDDGLDQLEAHLHEEKEIHHRTIQYVWCECTSNPLVRTPDLDRIRALANDYGFLVIVDDTIGTAANVNVLDVADIIVTSLSKSFNGRADAMGGSIYLNPMQPHHDELRRLFASEENAGYTDSSLLYHRDAQQIERNSRDYLPRISKMNANATRLVDLLTPLAGPKRALQRIYYPRDDPNYRARMRQVKNTQDDDDGGGFVPGYGGLFTLRFASVGVARTFFDALDVCKGSSLGAEMTLAQPYVQTVFPRKKEWAAQYGLYEAIVRCSIGVEDGEVLERVFGVAMEAAEKAFDNIPFGLPLESGE